MRAVIERRAQVCAVVVVVVVDRNGLLGGILLLFQFNQQPTRTTQNKNLNVLARLNAESLR